MKLFSIVFLVLFSINVIAEEAKHDESGTTSSQTEIDKRAKRTLERLEKFIKDACAVTRPAAVVPGATPQTGGQTGAIAGTTPSASNTTSPTPSTGSAVNSSTPSGLDGSLLFSSKCTQCHGIKDKASSAEAIRSGAMPPPGTTNPAQKISEEEKQAILGFLDSK